MEQPCETQGWIHLPFLAVEFQGNDGIAPLGAGKGADKHGGVLWTQLELWELWQYWSWISVGKGSRKCQFLPSLLICRPSKGFVQRRERQDLLGTHQD